MINNTQKFSDALTKFVNSYYEGYNYCIPSIGKKFYDGDTIVEVMFDEHTTSDSDYQVIKKGLTIELTNGAIDIFEVTERWAHHSDSDEVVDYDFHSSYQNPREFISFVKRYI